MNNSNYVSASVNLHSDIVAHHLAQYAALGWSIIPAHGVMMDYPDRCDQACACGFQRGRSGACSSPGKHPVGRWKNCPVASLRDLIRSRQQYIFESGGWEPNWAVVLGQSGIASLDIDNHRGGPDGRLAWAALESKYGPLPVTARDSRNHYLFRLPAAAAAWPTKVDIAPGVELLTGNAQADHILYIAPSEHASGASYRWLPGLAPWETPLAELPTWMIDLAATLAAQKKVATPTAPRSASVVGGYSAAAGTGDNDIVSRVRTYLSKVPGAVSGQDGHDVTFKVACYLVIEFDLSPTEAFPLFAEWNDTCSPPWTDAELRHKLDDANKQPGLRGKKRDSAGDGFGKEWRPGGEFYHLRGIKIEIVKPTRRGPRRSQPCSCPHQHSAIIGTDGAALMDDVASFFDNPELEQSNAAYREKRRAEDALQAALYAVAEKNFRLKFNAACCPVYKGILLGHKIKNQDALLDLRCENWACRPCAQYLAGRWKNNIAFRLLTSPDRPEPQEVFVGTVKYQDWPAFRQRLVRHSRTPGITAAERQYFAFEDDSGIFVVTTADGVLDNARKIPAKAASEELTRRLNLYIGKSRPMSSSRGWALPPEEIFRTDEWNLIGRRSENLKAEVIEGFLETIGVETERSTPQRETPGRLQGRLKLIYPAGWTQYQRDWVRQGIMFGHVPGGQDIFDVTEPPPAESPVDEIELVGAMVTPDGEVDLGAVTESPS